MFPFAERKIPMKFLNMQGSQFPALGFGTWMLEGEACINAVRTALEIGYRHIDTAQMYGNEAEVGRAVAASGIARTELFLTTKLWTSNLTSAKVTASMEESLSKLQTDYVDLLLIHWPEPSVPLSQTLHAMQELQRKGKVKHIGVSNFPVSWMREAVEKCRVQVACNQVEYHAMLSQKAVLEYARLHDIIVAAYRPLLKAQLGNNSVLEKIGKQYGNTAGQVALRWLIEQDSVAAIPKAASEKNARLNFDIFDFALSQKDRKTIATLSNNTRTVNPGFAPQWDAA